jgi:hypothetical protein
VPSIAELRGIVGRDLDPDFLETLSIAIAWEYSTLFDRLVDDATMDDHYRNEEFASQRGHVAVKAMVQAATQHGIPYDYWSLDCNGQRKLLVKAGRVILLQEPILTPFDAPRSADYKIELAATHSVVRQLELDLGDIPNRELDWSGCVLAVILHGARGQRFTREHKALGGLSVAVPDGTYEEWLVRVDLHQLAMHGLAGLNEAEAKESLQHDEVTVRLKKKPAQRSA